ncbi:MAG: HAMP domain-containing histidine kinase [Muribaculaceae bacterium]|nr:HAMP domain-containing histidine kinase [Muribaculaceae bacterium]
MMGRSLEELSGELTRRMRDVPLGECIEIRRGDIMRYRCYHLSFIQSGFKREFYLLESLTEEVMKAERNAYEKVIRIISHEVNNTMGGVRSVLETLHDFSESDEVREVIESCDNRCDQMTRFINSYADVVRVPEPVKEPVDINEMIGDMMPFLQGMGSEKVSLRFNPSEENIVADIDLPLMQQVIVNIVKNAIESITMKRDSRNDESVDGDSESSDSRNGDLVDGESESSDSRNGDLMACDSELRDSVYTDRDKLSGSRDMGHIDINIEEIEGHPMIEIGNNGEPISDAVSRQLFSPFFTTKREGRGIGLTLISEILNRHGATYSLKTTSDGITRFRILFR